MKVMVDLDPRDVWRIQEEAEKRGITPGEVVREHLSRRRSHIELHERIRSMVTGGMCDADIAAEFGMTTGAVARIRRGLGMPANKRYRRTV